MAANTTAIKQFFTAPLKKVDLLDLFRKTVEENKEFFVEKIKEQLLAGISRDGTPITPSYLEDPYFKSRESAERYAAFKFKITPNARRGRYTPNLFINGYYHSKIDLHAMQKNMEIFSTAEFAGEIDSKYGEDILHISTEFIKPDIGVIKNALGSLFKQAIGL